MMPEISLNVLDVAQNSVRAGASLISISVRADTNQDTLTIVIEDNGCGMTKEQAARVIDPFFTTRTTRKVGLGVPFFKLAAESTGGSFSIRSEPGVGTVVTAVFILSHIYTVSTTMLWLVKTQMSAAIFMALRTISSALISVFSINALAALKA